MTENGNNNSNSNNNNNDEDDDDDDTSLSAFAYFCGLRHIRTSQQHPESTKAYHMS